MKNLIAPLILASNSPRRKQILTEAGFEFTTLVKQVDEEYPKEIFAQNIPEFLAFKKAKAYSDESNNNIILTSDTIVILENSVLEKPTSENNAIEMLKSLSGNKHTVITAFCVAYKNQFLTYSDQTNVFFKELSDEEIHFYVDKFKPLDKAGAYGIQEWIGMIAIEKIQGSYFTVMGLPIHLVYNVLMSKFAT